MSASHRVRISQLSASQHRLLSSARRAYTSAGGDVDAWTDAMLIRFLVHASWDGAAAERALEATAAWRVRVGAAAMRKRVAAGDKAAEAKGYVELLSAVSFALMHRETRAGQLLHIAHIGSFDPSLWLRSGGADELDELVLFLLELLTFNADKASVQRGVLVEHALLLDYDGLQLKHLDPRVLLRVRTAMMLPGENYPLLLRRAVAVNAPPIFQTLWNIMNGWLSDDLRAAVEVHPPATSAAAIAALARPSALPACYNGDNATMPQDVRAANGIEKIPQGQRRYLFPGDKFCGYLAE